MIIIIHFLLEMLVGTIKILFVRLVVLLRRKLDGKTTFGHGLAQSTFSVGRFLGKRQERFVVAIIGCCSIIIVRGGWCHDDADPLIVQKCAMVVQATNMVHSTRIRNLVRWFGIHHRIHTHTTVCSYQE